MVTLGLRHLTIVCFLWGPFIIFISVLDKIKFITKAMPIFSLALVYGNRVGGEDFSVPDPPIHDRTSMV